MDNIIEVKPRWRNTGYAIYDINRNIWKHICRWFFAKNKGELQHSTKVWRAGPQESNLTIKTKAIIIGKEEEEKTIKTVDR